MVYCGTRNINFSDNSLGHPTWYGDRFDLKDPITWPEPDETAVTTLITKKGKTYTVQLAYWQNWVRTGKKDIPMNKLPFTLVCARVLDEDGNPVFKRDLWRLAIGERRRELSH